MVEIAKVYNLSKGEHMNKVKLEQILENLQKGVSRDDKQINYVDRVATAIDYIDTNECDRVYMESALAGCLFELEKRKFSEAQCCAIARTTADVVYPVFRKQFESDTSIKHRISMFTALLDTALVVWDTDCVEKSMVTAYEKIVEDANKKGE